jgi:sulfatase maturation enzyme AslB (radical SAM superfamily)
MSLDKIISARDYKIFAGPDWPSYQEIVVGKKSSNENIQHEVDDFVNKMTQTYQEMMQTGNVIAEANQHRQQQIFYNKNYQHNNSCTIPWNTMGVNARGDVFICSSPSWVPKFVGNLLQTSDVFDILNSTIAQQIRQEILAGRYYYCNPKICSFFSNKSLASYQHQPTHDQAPLPFVSSSELLVDQIPKNLIFDFDYTCNFRCPSCRTELINHNKHHAIRSINNSIVQRIKHQIIDRIQDQHVEIRWCGGEPFISEPYTELLEYISCSGKTKIQHIIQTNGSYLQSKSDTVERLLPSLKELRISFDAATANTYQKIRINGMWDTLLANTKWVRNLIQEKNAPTVLSADFVVQLDNYHEIPAFVELCNELKIKNINFQKMWNWGTWSQEEFAHKNIYNTDHAEYEKLVAVFKSVGRHP